MAPTAVVRGTTASETPEDIKKRVSKEKREAAAKTRQEAKEAYERTELGKAASLAKRTEKEAIEARQLGNRLKAFPLTADVSLQCLELTVKLDEIFQKINVEVAKESQDPDVYAEAKEWLSSNLQKHKKLMKGIHKIIAVVTIAEKAERNEYQEVRKTILCYDPEVRLDSKVRIRDSD